uniref:RNA ligase/cyclic nucleotide phosphodiesterase family protein n=1 Tax=Chenopodium quinoa TaxID=63459 RepID=A0A803NDD8_CHEQI
MSHHTIDRKPSGDEEGAYAVWATPSKDAKIRLKKLMSGLRSKFGGPKFDPHLTVVGPISLTGKMQQRNFGQLAGAYLPHMSLLYGDLTDEEKNEAIDEAKTLDDTIDSMSFAIDRLELYITPDDKTLKSWIKVEEYVLCAH